VISMLRICYIATRMDNFPRGMQVGNGNTWTAQQTPFGAPPLSSMPQWPNGLGKHEAPNANDLLISG